MPSVSDEWAASERDCVSECVATCLPQCSQGQFEVGANIKQVFARLGSILREPSDASGCCVQRVSPHYARMWVWKSVYEHLLVGMNVLKQRQARTQ